MPNNALIAKIVERWGLHL